jgi:hypothetical protein
MDRKNTATLTTDFNPKALVSSDFASSNITSELKGPALVVVVVVNCTNNNHQNATK